MRATAIFIRYRDIAKTKYKRPFSIDYRERGSYARSVYPTEDTSRMVIARVKTGE